MADPPYPFRFMGLLESTSPSALYELKVKNCLLEFQIILHYLLWQAVVHIGVSLG